MDNNGNVMYETLDDYPIGYESTMDDPHPERAEDTEDWFDEIAATEELIQEEGRQDASRD